MDYALNMMDSALKMMDSALKMMDFQAGMEELLESKRRAVRQQPFNGKSIENQ